MNDLRGHQALISGGLGDIGRALARALAERGAGVSLGDVLPESDAEALLEELRSFGVEVNYVQVDVRDAAAVREWVRNCEPCADIVIANAATVHRAPPLDIDPAQWRNDLAIALDGAFHLLQSAAQRLVEDGRAGRLVAVGSWAADHVHLHMMGYCVAKAGLRMLVRCLALELASRNILVNEIAPGWVDAGLSGKLMQAEPELRERSRQRAPVRALISAEEVATATLPLCDFDQRHLTGQCLVLDGGISLLCAASQEAPSHERGGR